MTTFWKIVQCERLVADGFIQTAHWEATEKDGDYIANLYGLCEFATATPVIPFASVTEQEVLDWCWTNGVNKDAIETSLAANIKLQKNPIVAIGVPW